MAICDIYNNDKEEFNLLHVKLRRRDDLIEAFGGVNKLEIALNKLRAKVPKHMLEDSGISKYKKKFKDSIDLVGRSSEMYYTIEELEEEFGLEEMGMLVDHEKDPKCLKISGSLVFGDYVKVRKAIDDKGPSGIKRAGPTIRFYLLEVLVSLGLLESYGSNKEFNNVTDIAVYKDIIGYERVINLITGNANSVSVVYPNGIWLLKNIELNDLKTAQRARKLHPDLYHNIHKI